MKLSSRTMNKLYEQLHGDWKPCVGGFGGFYNASDLKRPKDWEPIPSDVARLRAAEMLDRQFGSTSLKKVKSWLFSHGLALADEPPRCPTCGRKILKGHAP